LAEKTLEFEIMTGQIVIDLRKCEACVSKACIAACSSNIFIENGPRIDLNRTREEIKRGGCTESLTCELECQLKGGGGLTVVLPMPEFDQYAEMMRERSKNDL
jgi:ferredoxin